eukprot:gnl/Hemi2/17679_TR5825_c0_g16_i1.p1 gnl/Hemi2/17679_TR5825_c0_g16~~gnl/Hemi2/17679_TR5825_c0_g16_i1.p1  ORF type:complete len:228 (-),score=42.06 gnl/Hemi2/17679_TR5825_c0_g16_i1:153-836(-)
MFEMLIGYPPFYSDEPLVTCRKIICWRDHLRFPEDCQISAESKDLLLRLTCDADNRLGSRSIDEIKTHPFFRGVDWETIRHNQSPYIPEISSPTDTRHFDTFEQTPPWRAHWSSDSRYKPKSKLMPSDLPFLGYTYKRFPGQVSSHKRTGRASITSSTFPSNGGHDSDGSSSGTGTPTNDHSDLTVSASHNASATSATTSSHTLPGTTSAAHNATTNQPRVHYDREK